MKNRNNTLNARVGTSTGAWLAAGVVAVLLTWSTTVTGENFADRTPGDRHLAEGVRAYENGRYQRAMTSFINAARWADKVAQFNIGVMYLYGEGVDHDPARAWAWLQLSAERKYPMMMDTAEHVWERLYEEEREQGLRILNEELKETFGDHHAVPRTARYMKRQQRRMTGSRTGSSAGVSTVWEVEHAQWDNPDANSARGLYITGTRYRGDEYYDPAKFNFYEVLAAESILFDAESRGEVRLGELKILEESSDSDD